jgi:tetratricopeptide (TPR) repeat protein
MSATPPASPLITPDLRRRLQQRYEEAVRLLNQQPADHARVHELLAECLRADPGNILYLDALLANLRHWPPGGRGWLQSWWSGRPSAGRHALSIEYSVLSTQYLASAPIDREAAATLLQNAPELLRDAPTDTRLYQALAAACAACDLDQAEVRYLQVAHGVAPADLVALRALARALTRRGRFEDALRVWNQILGTAPDDESRQAAFELRDANMYETADDRLAAAHSAAGEDLAIREQREDLRLARGEQQVSMARRRAASDPHPMAQALVLHLEAEQLRQEIEILNLRCERLPGNIRLRLELARKLKQAGNFSGAIQRLEEARSDPALAAEVLLELGECWQHLRQFEKAMGFYRQSISSAEERREPRPLVAALYRVAVLAAAMNQRVEARQALERLMAIEPGYKDARERLDKLRAN